MARTPGSKSKKTLIAELRQLGRTDDFEGCSCENLRFELGKMQRVVPAPPPPVPVVKSTLPAEKAHALIEQAKVELGEIINRYAPGGVDKWDRPVTPPEYVQNYLNRIRLAKDIPQAEEFAAKAVDRMFVAMLAMWAGGSVTGPNTAANLEKRVRNAESLAMCLEKKGLVDQANAQRERAQELRATSCENC